MTRQGEGIGSWPAVILVIISTAFVYLIPQQALIGVGTAYIGVHVLMTGSMLWIWYRNGLSVKALIAIAIIARLILLPSPLLTSNDAERYLWDGAVTLSGLNPYEITPNTDQAQPLREVWPTPPEHAKYATIYPPGAILLFSLSALAGPVYGLWVWKALLTIAGIVSVFIVYDVLKSLKLQRHLPLFALSPLLILETGVGAHLDTLLVLIVALVLWALTHGKTMLMGLIIGAGMTIKFIPMLMLGPLILTRSIRQSALLLLASSFVPLLLYGGLLLVGIKPVGVLLTFFEKWRFGSPVFKLLETYLQTMPLILALGAIFLFFIALSAHQARKQRIVIALAVVIAAPFVISPAVFPWYLCVLVPLLTLKPNIILLTWVSVAPVTYEVLNLWIPEGRWEPAVWPLVFLALSLLGALLVSLYTNLSVRTSPTA